MVEINGAEMWQTMVALTIVAWAAGWIAFKLFWPGKPSSGCGSCGSCPQRDRPSHSTQLYQLHKEQPLK